MIKLFESYNNIIDKFKNMLFIRNEYYIFMVEDWKETKKTIQIIMHSNEKSKYSRLDFEENYRFLSEDEKQAVFNDELVIQVFCKENNLRKFRPKYFSEIVGKEIKKAEYRDKMLDIDPYGEEDWISDNNSIKENVEWIYPQTIDIGAIFKTYWKDILRGGINREYYLEKQKVIEKLNDILVGKLVRYDDRKRVFLIIRVSLGHQSLYLHCSDLGVRDVFDTITIVGDPETYDGHWAGKVKIVISDEDPYGEEDWGDIEEAIKYEENEIRKKLNYEYGWFYFYFNNQQEIKIFLEQLEDLGFEWGETRRKPTEDPPRIELKKVVVLMVNFKKKIIYGIYGSSNHIKKYCFNPEDLMEFYSDFDEKTKKYEEKRKNLFLKYQKFDPYGEEDWGDEYPERMIY